MSHQITHDESGFYTPELQKAILSVNGQKIGEVNIASVDLPENENIFSAVRNRGKTAHAILMMAGCVGGSTLVAETITQMEVNGMIPIIDTKDNEFLSIHTHPFSFEEQVELPNADVQRLIALADQEEFRQGLYSTNDIPFVLQQRVDWGDMSQYKKDSLGRRNSTKVAVSLGNRNAKRRSSSQARKKNRK